MKVGLPTSCTNVSFPSSDTSDTTPQVSLKTLANNVLREADGDRTAQIRARLLRVAAGLGIPASIVFGLPTQELDATAEQYDLCQGYKNGNGDPLPESLLTFYLRGLADGVAL